jgi:hypothetical protein
MLASLGTCDGNLLGALNARLLLTAELSHHILVFGSVDVFLSSVDEFVRLILLDELGISGLSCV